MKSKCDSVVSIEKIPEDYLPHLTMRIKNKKLEHFIASGKKITRRQDVEKAYIRSGCFYFGKSEVIIKMKSI